MKFTSFIFNDLFPYFVNLDHCAPCKYPKCRTCTHINHSTTITYNNNSCHINVNFTCSSACLVYCISCKQCDMIYIGETSRQLNVRFGEHLRSVEKKVHLQESLKDNPDSTVSQNFNNDSHSITDITITGHCYAPLDSIKRKL